MRIASCTPRSCSTSSASRSDWTVSGESELKSDFTARRRSSTSEARRLSRAIAVRSAPLILLLMMIFLSSDFSVGPREDAVAASTIMRPDPVSWTITTLPSDFWTNSWPSNSALRTRRAESPPSSAICVAAAPLVRKLRLLRSSIAAPRAASSPHAGATIQITNKPKIEKGIPRRISAHTVR